jgi:hypothetical protein
MFHIRWKTDITQQLPIVTVRISIHDASNDVEIQKPEVALFPLSEDRGKKANLLQIQHHSPSKQKLDMVMQLEERMVHKIQAQEPLSNGVMWWQLKLMMGRIL